MTFAIPASAAVVLPGTGSDELFAGAVFAGPLAAVGVNAQLPPPPPGDRLIPGYFAALDAAAARGPILVGGISFGAHLAAEWAVANRDRCAGVLAALPAWQGAPGDAPASLAARASADLVRRTGLEATLRASTAGVPHWLADELTRAWRRHGDDLADSLLAAACHSAPALSALATLDVPVGIAACVDDPVHPAAIAHAWASALPRAVVVESTLAALGEDRESLGRAAVLAFLRAQSATAT
ncbi:alpha/beta hydrolase [Amycolatopsis sp. CA-230715]|uniref:alpha/beta hydrolase n=1 Tax=Amycolatopsis sp. CA-230715 TaxID=2745196 RepID=UPI001C03190B